MYGKFTCIWLIFMVNVGLNIPAPWILWFLSSKNSTTPVGKKETSTESTGSFSPLTQLVHKPPSCPNPIRGSVWKPVLLAFQLFFSAFTEAAKATGPWSDGHTSSAKRPWTLLGFFHLPPHRWNNCGRSVSLRWGRRGGTGGFFVLGFGRTAIWFLATRGAIENAGEEEPVRHGYEWFMGHFSRFWMQKIQKI